MLLCIDIGNTDITYGVFKGDDVILTFRTKSKTSHTSDEYGVQIIGILRENGIEKTQIKGVAISSVVPNIMYSFVNGIIKYFKLDPLVIQPGVKTGIAIKTENPKEVGADRIVDAVGAYYRYGGPLIVIDFGTATTFDVVDEEGSFIAAVTTPGIKITLQALISGAAKLPEIEIQKPASILAKNTVTSMQAGLVYGYIGQVEYIVGEIKRELNLPDMKVIATGGLSSVIKPHTKVIDHFDRDLTLRGLKMIYDRNQKA